ncbi:hypothetical protein COK36_29700 [Bacillus cereus]|uniref:hypothetical protein n=1 Tax=Bacillus cereus group TaxID=86661 RepID=UPI000B446A9D|nr:MULTISPECIES: hypothetical protein [Bacillus cereus group]MEB9739350.1 hypothetical protein [Bacillus cereus]OTW82757.1 hypothetical protein BK713_15365 [Bacillus thuringiensis serovar jinghongiensis]OTX12802.1 hypothetical protein BK715_28235 [Bacillus thuringiensis serovar japonensis]PEF11028.1 hypothetical protein CON23_18040 [Bacillus thuringiensis]PEX66362.1 hypothetical protein CN462_21285 [Bacillus cereus]
MDFIAYNRAHLNNRRIRKLDDKVMVFVVPSIVQVGIVRTELRFPYEGELVDAYVTCGTMGESKTCIDIERCSQSSYDTTPIWHSILADELVIDGKSKSNRTSSTPYSFKPSQLAVNRDDHFRINIKEVGKGVKDITVELVVELALEE